MGLSKDWDKAESDAFKVLGDKGGVPTRKMQVVYGVAGDSLKAYKAIAEAGELLSKNVAVYRAAFPKMQDALRAARSEMMGDNFELDPKKPEDKKKIDQARAIFDKYYSAYARILSAQNQAIDEIAKSVGHFSKLTQLYP